MSRNRGALTGCTWAVVAVLAATGASAWAGYGGLGPTEEEAAWVRAHVGMYAWGCKTEKELADVPREDKVALARRLGVRIIRDALTLRPEPWRRDYDPTCLTFLDQLRTPGWRKLAEAFDVIILTLADGSGRQYEPAWTRAHFQALTEYLLRTYADQDKTFILGNWEGDHWLSDPEKAVPLFRARAEGVAASRAAVPGSRARAYFMLEMVLLDFEGKTRLVNHTAPRVPADLYSLSSWAYLDQLTRALDYIKSKAPDSAAFGKRNCMIGEIGAGANWTPQGEQVARARAQLAELRRWGAPFVTWWELRGQDFGLQDTGYDGARKRALYYWFYRAYHDRDDPLEVDDFEADPWGAPGGDLSPEGQSLNCLGGRRQVAGQVSACLVRDGATGARSLRLDFGDAGGAWSEEVLGLNARRFVALRLALRGSTQALQITLTDGAGKTAAVSLDAYAGPAAPDGWRRAAVPLTAFGGIGLGDLCEVSLSRPGRGTVWVDDLAFAGAQAASPPAREGARFVPRAAHLMLTRADQPLPLDAPDAARLTAAWLTTCAGQRLLKPTLSDGDTSLELAEELPPGTTLEVVPGGSSHVRFGPLREMLDVRAPDRAGLLTHRLSGQPQFHCFLAEDPGGDSWLQWRYASPFPVRHFRLAVYGNVQAGSAATIKVLLSPDGRRWSEAALDKRDWDETFWIARPPQDFAPTPTLWMRVQLLPDKAKPDFPWTVSVSDLKADLWLDTEACRGPKAKLLRFTDAGPAEGPRGVLDADW